MGVGEWGGGVGGGQDEWEEGGKGVEVESGSGEEVNSSLIGSLDGGELCITLDGVGNVFHFR